MGIYRGAGGSGDAVNDASSEALITIQARDAALAAQAAAEAAQTAAELAETNAETAETNAETAETNAETAASNAASSASAASTSASNAATSATNAANSATAAQTAETNAETAETNAAASASAASTSASNAATSASNASTSATNAANSATAAQAAQAAAEAALDQFDDTYLGAKASNPTVDNDGNALTTGDQYFNTVANELRIWNGSSWQSASTVGGTVTSLTVTGAFAANGSTTIGDAAGDSVTINASTVSTPNGISFNGTSIPASKTLVVNTDIGSTVQAYDVDTAKLDVAQSWSAAQSFNAGVTLGDASGDALTINSSAVSIPNGLNFDSNTFVIDATNNRVGVGVLNPAQTLDVQSASGGTTARLRNTTGNFIDFIETSGSSRTGYIGTTNGTNFVIHNDKAGQMQFDTNNAERMRIDSSGNVGIGTTSGTYRLNLFGNANAFRVDATNSATDVLASFAGRGVIGVDAPGTPNGRFIITDAGNVGIGTSSPNARFNVSTATAKATASTINSGIFSSSDAQGSADLLLAIRQGGSATQSARWTGIQSYENGYGVQNLVLQDLGGNVGIGISSSLAGKLHVSGADANNLGTFSGGTRALRIGADSSESTIQGVDNTGITNYRALALGGGNYVRFLTGSDGGGSISERMRIDSSGNVGIGTSSPGQVLEVSKSQDTETQVRVVNANTGSSARSGFVLGNNSNAGAASLLLNSSNNTGLGGANALNMYQGLSAPIAFFTNATERMRIDSSGNVGIGTSSPTNLGSTVKTLELTAGSSAGGGGYYLSSNGTTTTQLGTDGVSGYIGTRSNHPVAFTTNNTERMRITSGGDLLVSKTASDDTTAGLRYVAAQYLSIVRDGNPPLYLNRLSSDGRIQEFARSNTIVGNISVTTTATTYNTSSDYRLKENIAPMTGALNIVAQLKPCTYSWKVDGSAGQGFIAHELQAVVPDCVTGEKDAVDAEGKPVYQGVDTSFLVATLTAAIQEQQAIIEELKTRIETLENK